ncbi:MAG: STAS domain-containing protein, partial [Oscillospiraceae bacterium]|nr:STAS domain-containing protein [Oscillospiraceae bacterium]
AADAEAHMVQAGERFETLILDMAQLEYVSSAGLRALKRVHVTMRRKGGSLMVKNVTKPVMEVFEITGFAGMLKFI